MKSELMTGRSTLVGLCYVGATILLTVYGQLIIKWRVGMAGSLPAGGLGKLEFLLRRLLDVWVFSGFVAAFLASLTWMAAMTQLPLSYAYPFMSLAFVLVMLASAHFFGEALTTQKVAGALLVVLGLYVASTGRS